MKKIVFALIAAAALNVSAETARVCVNVGDGDVCQWFEVPVRAVTPSTPDQTCYVNVGDAGQVACPASYGKVLKSLNAWLEAHGFRASAPRVESPYQN